MEAIERLKARLAEAERGRREPIAIIGLGCRFPGGEDPDAFWDLLARGGDAIGPVPVDRWDADALFDPDPTVPGRCVAREGGFIGPPQLFDAAFFGLSPKEAATLDPQQRLLLEVSWEAMERGGIVPGAWRGSRVGVFVGISGHDYSQRLLGRPLSHIDPYLATGNSHSVAAGRLAYTYGFTGPALSVDTACSSSLVALHLACRSLANRECDAALSAGVNRLLSPEFSINFSAARMLAPDGRCKTFSADADGFARAEGCGVVVLKRLGDAQADGDSILAVVRGSAVNHDGRSGGLTVPNGPSQQAVLRAALDDAGVSAGDISYVEAHGTGTELGDPIEAGALAAVFGESPRSKPLAIGSVKTNVGHMEAAAGIGGVIKVVLAMRHGWLPAHLHFTAPNPHIRWSGIPLRVTHRGEPWPTVESRLAGVSSFGFSGTNGHVVLGEAPVPATDAASPADPNHGRESQPASAVTTSARGAVLMLSAKDPAALSTLAERYAVRLESGADWYDVCYSVNRTRTRFAHRFALVANDSAAGAARLRSVVNGGTRADDVPPRPYAEAASRPRVAFLFPGQGAQRPAMGRALYASQPAFRQAFDRCAALLAAGGGPDLVGLLFPGERGLVGADRGAELDQTALAQPALFALEYALTEQWRAWGVEPDAVLGHSVGEFAAAVAAGVLSLEDALSMVAARGRLMQALPPGGGMAVLFADLGAVTPLLGEKLSVAALNGPRNTVVAGPRAALAGLAESARQRGIGCRELAVSHAFHSSAMTPMRATFARIAATAAHGRGTTAYYSTVTGGPVDGGPDGAEYWVRQISEPVRFAAAARALAADGVDLVLEIGPRPVLGPLFVDAVEGWRGRSLSSLDSDEDGIGRFLTALAALFEEGVDPVWGGAEGRVVSLPTYAFNRRRHWAAGPAYRPTAPADSGHLLGAPFRAARSDDQTFPLAEGLVGGPLWQQHRVFGVPVLPAVAYLDMAFAAAGTATPALAEVRFTGALALTEDVADAQLVLAAGRGERGFEIVSRRGESWTTHCVGRVVSEVPAITPPELPACRARCTNVVDVDACYARLAADGIEYGDSWRLIESVQTGDDELVARVAAPAWPARQGSVHPLVLDACVQSIAALFVEREWGATHLPAGVGRTRVYRPATATSAYHCHCVVRPGTDRLEADVTVFDDEGAPLIGLQSLVLRPADAAALHGEALPAGLFLELDWQLAPPPGGRTSPAPVEVVAAIAPAFEDERRSPAHADYRRALAALDDLAVAFAARIRADHDDTEVGSAMQPLWQRLGALATSATDPVPAWDDLAGRAAALREASPAAAVETDLLVRCARAMPEVLRGEREPLEVLFPGGDASALSRLYRDSPGSRIMNLALRDAFRALRAARPGRLRVLEIGGGTGGTTAWLMPPGAEVDYRFTDVSPLLVERARAELGEHAGVRFDVFDVTRDAAGQGIEPGTQDIVIAANVLHATPDLDATVHRVAELLAPGGVLLLLEITAPLAWLDLVFGLTRGWFAFADSALRPDHGIVDAPAWRELLARHGLSSACLPGTDGGEGDPAPQSLLIGRREAGATDERHRLVGPETDPLVRTLATTFPAQFTTTDPNGHRPPVDGAAAPERHWVFVAAISRDVTAVEVEVDRFLDTVRAAAAAAKRPRLTVVTRGATGGSVRAAPSDVSAMPFDAVLAGLARTVQLEHPELECRLIDLDPADPVVVQCESLARDLRADGAELVRYRGGRREVARLDRVTPSRIDGRPAGDIEIVVGERTGAEGVRFRELDPEPPAAGEVAIRIEAAGINFIDLLDVVGMLPFSRDWLGVECAGRVVAVGEGAPVEAGEPVIALARGSLRSQVNVPAALVSRRPHGLDARRAATIPACFLTAWHALVEVARIGPSDRILVHAGAGGTGMAAIQVARLRGAEVFATASRAKWPALRHLGIAEPMDSRSVGFGARVRELTGGDGVDVVLNSLTGEFVDEGLAALASGGRFVEIGKRDVRDPAEIAALRPDVRYLPVDLMALAEREPERIRALFSALLPLFEGGALTPLPHQAFAPADVPAALASMQRGEHIGKLVVDFEHEGVPVESTASYLVTGGLGGLGLATAGWLVDQGARALVLLGRRIPETPPAAVTALRERGAEVVLVAGDVADRDAVARAIARAEALGPLRGVVHAAGVLSDALLADLDAARVAESLRPKAYGGLHLDLQTRSRSLDFFVLYSSAASLFGSPGQGAHVAANSFLDALALNRRSLGLPALSINWGPWSEIGAAADRETGETLGKRGVELITPRQGLAALAMLLAKPDAARVGVVAVDWLRFGRSGALADPRFDRLLDPIATVGDDAGTNGAAGGWRDELATLPPGRRAAALVGHLQRELSQVLGMAEDELPAANAGFFDLGIDSLMSVELKNRLSRGLGVELTAITLFQHPNIEALADHLAESCFPQQGAERQGGAGDRRSMGAASPTTSDSTAEAIEDELRALDALLRQNR